MNLRRVNLSPHLGARRQAQQANEYYQLARDLGVARWKAQELAESCLKQARSFLKPTRTDWDKTKDKLIDWATRGNKVVNPALFDNTVDNLNLPAQADPHPDLTKYKEK